MTKIKMKESMSIFKFADFMQCKNRFESFISCFLEHAVNIDDEAGKKMKQHAIDQLSII